MIYVLGGHALACHYIKHLLHARDEGLISFKAIHFVDENPNAKAFTEFGHLATGHTASYASFIGELLQNSKSTGTIIPDHTAPHVFFQVFLKLLKEHPETKDRTISLTPSALLDLPFEKKLDQGLTALSYATWVCPLECEEPDHCPAIDKPRSWTMATSLKDKLQSDSVHILECEQLAYGVAHIPLTAIRKEWEALFNHMINHKEGTFSVATVSKCHGILGEAHFSSVPSNNP